MQTRAPFPEENDWEWESLKTIGPDGGSSSRKYRPMSLLWRTATGGAGHSPGTPRPLRKQPISSKTFLAYAESLLRAERLRWHGHAVCSVLTRDLTAQE